MFYINNYIEDKENIDNFRFILNEAEQLKNLFKQNNKIICKFLMMQESSNKTTKAWLPKLLFRQ